MENISCSASFPKILVMVSCPCVQGKMCAAVVLSLCIQYRIIGHQRLACSAFWAIISFFRKFPRTVVSRRPPTTPNPFGHRVNVCINHRLDSLVLGLSDVTRSPCLSSSLFYVCRAPSLLTESIAASVLYHAFACLVEFSGRLWMDIFGSSRVLSICSLTNLLWASQ